MESRGGLASYYRSLYGFRKYTGAGLRAPSALRGRRQVQMQVDQQQLAELEAALQKLPESVRRKVAKGAMRRVTKAALAVARSNTPVRTGRLRKAIVPKVRTYRKVVWAAIGGRVQTIREVGIHKAAKRKQELGNDYLGAGWRVHFTEYGYFPGGGFNIVLGRHMLRAAGTVFRYALRPAIEADIAQVLREGRLT